MVSNAVYKQVALSLTRGYFKASSSADIIQNGVVFKYNYVSMMFNCLLCRITQLSACGLKSIQELIIQLNKYWLKC